MYAMTSISNIAPIVERVTTDMQAQPRNFAEPLPSPPKYNEQSPPSNIVSDKAPVSALESSDKSNNNTAQDNVPKQQFNQAQQKKINQFNLVMVEQSTKNTNADINESTRTQIEHQAQNGNLQAAKNPTSSTKIAETPYMIIVVNQTLAYMQKLMSSVGDDPPPEKSKAPTL